MRRTLVVLIFVAASVGIAPPAHAHGCFAWLSQFFSSGGVTTGFYVGVESNSSTSAFITHRSSDGANCDDRFDVGYSVHSHPTFPYPATVGSDFEPVTGIDSTGSAGDDFQIPVPLFQDGAVEPVEAARVGLSNRGDVTFAGATQAPIYIVDDDGATRVGFGFPRVSRREREVARFTVPVFRSGPVGTSGDVSYSVGPGPANGAEGSDWEGDPEGVLSFAAGERVKLISLALVDDRIDEGENETIRITLTGPSVDPAGSTFTVVIVEDDGSSDAQAPETRFHHPKHGVTYSKDGFALREWHAFANDNDRGTGVKKTKFALRKRMRSGRCKWWDGDGFVRRACSERLWTGRRVRLFTGSTLWYYRPRAQLRPSIGTRIKNYTIFSKALDYAGNVEDEFEVGRNKNTFEVKKGS